MPRWTENGIQESVGLDRLLLLVDGGVHAVPEGQADARPRLRDLGDAVLPRPLGLSAGDQQIPLAEEEGRRLAAALGAEQEAPRLAERDEDDDRILDLLADAIAVPRDAVLPVAVEVEADGVELHSVPFRQGLAHVLEHRGLEGFARVLSPRRGETRLTNF